MEDQFEQQQKVIVTILDYLPFIKQRIDQVEEFTLNVLKNITTQVKSLETKLQDIQQKQEKQALKFENLLLQYTNQTLERKIDQQSATIQQLESQTSPSKDREQNSAEYTTQKVDYFVQTKQSSPRLGTSDVANLQSQIDDLKQQLSASYLKMQQFNDTMLLTNQEDKLAKIQESKINEAQKITKFQDQNYKRDVIEEIKPSITTISPDMQPLSTSWTRPETGEPSTLPEPLAVPVLASPEPRPSSGFIPLLTALAQEASQAYSYASKIHAQIALVSLQTPYHLSSKLEKILEQYIIDHPDAADDAFGFLKTSPYVATAQDVFKRFVTVNNSPIIEIDVAFEMKNLLNTEIRQVIIPFSVVENACFNYGILNNTGIFNCVQNDYIYIFDTKENQNDIICTKKSLKENDDTDGQELTITAAIQQLPDQIDVVINTNNNFDLQVFCEKQIRHLQLQNNPLVNFDCIQLDSIRSLTLIKCQCPNLACLTSLKSLILSDVQLMENQDDDCNITSKDLEYLAIRWSKQIAVKIMSKLQTGSYQENSKLKYLEIYESQLKESMLINYPQLQYLILQYNKEHGTTFINYEKVRDIKYISVSTILEESGNRPQSIHIDAENITQKWVQH